MSWIVIFWHAKKSRIVIFFRFVRNGPYADVEVTKRSSGRKSMIPAARILQQVYTCASTDPIARPDCRVVSGDASGTENGREHNAAKSERTRRCQPQNARRGVRAGYSSTGVPVTIPMRVVPQDHLHRPVGNVLGHCGAVQLRAVRV